MFSDTRFDLPYVVMEWRNVTHYGDQENPRVICTEDELAKVIKLMQGKKYTAIRTVEEVIPLEKLATYSEKSHIVWLHANAQTYFQDKLSFEFCQSHPDMVQEYGLKDKCDNKWRKVPRMAVQEPTF